MNRGTLASSAAPDAGDDAYAIRYDATTGGVTRTGNAIAHGGFDVDPPELSENDRRALTYTSLPVEHPTDVIGYPVAHLWVQWAATDGDLFVYLEDVTPVRSAGATSWQSRYVTEGCLRASHRTLAKPIPGDIDVPQHESLTSSMAPLTPGPIELTIVLDPTAYRFAKGHRLRVTITGADHDNYLTPVRSPAPTVRVLRGGDHASRVVLPLMKAP